MRAGDHSESGVIRRIERVVCECVNSVYSDRSPLDGSILYGGRTNTSIPSRIARGAVFSLSHDRFGLSYHAISRHAGITSRNVIRSVRAYKDAPDTDDSVRRVKGMIDERLKRLLV